MKPEDEPEGCALPRDDYARVTLAHGGGGRLGAELLSRVFVETFANPILTRLEDSATLPEPGGRLAFTTDGFVVHPLFFPGGDIGRLAIAGTVNDLAVSGATPRYLSAAFILEEGFGILELTRIAESMRDAAAEAGVELVAGDTKVVERGKGDGVFICTTGIGVVPEGRRVSVSSAEPGDVVIVSGTLGDHGIALMTLREGLELESPLVSDCAPLSGLCQVLFEAVPSLRVLRDPTRGGLGSALLEIARASGVGIALQETELPVRPEVHAVCEILGLDPLFVANEGKVVLCVAEEHAETALQALRSHPYGRLAATVGRVVAERPGSVTMRSAVGGVRRVMQPSGEQLPRIC